MSYRNFFVDNENGESLWKRWYIIIPAIFLIIFLFVQIVLSFASPQTSVINQSMSIASSEAINLTVSIILFIAIILVASLYVKIRRVEHINKLYMDHLDSIPHDILYKLSTFDEKFTSVKVIEQQVKTYRYQIEDLSNDCRHKSFEFDEKLRHLVLLEQTFKIYRDQLDNLKHELGHNVTHYDWLDKKAFLHEIHGMVNSLQVDVVLKRVDEIKELIINMQGSPNDNQDRGEL